MTKYKKKKNQHENLRAENIELESLFGKDVVE